MAELLNTRDFPPGGWTYRERATGVDFSGSNLEDLVAQVSVHRKYKGLPVETTRQDIEDQICLRLGEGPCRAREGETYEPVSDRRSSLTVGMVTSLNKALFSFLKGGAKFVAPEVTAGRLATCKTCPFNIPASSCSCHAAYRVIEAVLPTHTPGVSVCSACGCSLQAKMVLPDEVISESIAPGTAFPPWCWQRNLLKRRQKPDTEV